jgi:hypothetical protein
MDAVKANATMSKKQGDRAGLLTGEFIRSRTFQHMTLGGQTLLKMLDPMRLHLVHFIASGRNSRSPKNLPSPLSQKTVNFAN